MFPNHYLKGVISFPSGTRFQELVPQILYLATAFTAGQTFKQKTRVEVTFDGLKRQPVALRLAGSTADDVAYFMGAFLDTHPSRRGKDPLVVQGVRPIICTRQSCKLVVSTTTWQSIQSSHIAEQLSVTFSPEELSIIDKDIRTLVDSNVKEAHAETKLQEHESRIETPWLKTLQTEQSRNPRARSRHSHQKARSDPFACVDNVLPGSHSS